LSQDCAAIYCPLSQYGVAISGVFLYFPYFEKILEMKNLLPKLSHAGLTAQAALFLALIVSSSLYFIA